MPHLAEMQDCPTTAWPTRDKYLQINFPGLRLVPDYLLVLTAGLNYTHAQTPEDVASRLIALGLLELNMVIMMWSLDSSVDFWQMLVLRQWQRLVCCFCGLRCPTLHEALELSPLGELVSVHLPFGFLEVVRTGPPLAETTSKH